MDKEVKFRIKIETEGKYVLKTLKIDAEDFNKAIEQTYAETKRLNDAMTSFAMAGMLHECFPKKIKCYEKA